LKAHEVAPEVGVFLIQFILDAQELRIKGLSYDSLGKLAGRIRLGNYHLGLPRFLQGVIRRLFLIENVPTLLLIETNFGHGLHRSLDAIIKEADKVGLILPAVGLGGFLPLCELLVVELDAVDLRHPLTNLDAGVFYERAGH
jgi:hypothetical protein